jgi:hypothetical protein
MAAWVVAAWAVAAWAVGMVTRVIPHREDTNLEKVLYLPVPAYRPVWAPDHVTNPISGVLRRPEQ